MMEKKGTHSSWTAGKSQTSTASAGGAKKPKA